VFFLSHAEVREANEGGLTQNGKYFEKHARQNAKAFVGLNNEIPD